MAGLLGGVKNFASSHEWLEKPARRYVRRWRSTKFNHRVSRKRFAMTYFNSKLSMIDEWSSLRTESDNFYYDLTPHNRSDLASLVSLITGEKVHIVEGFLCEIAGDAELRRHVKSTLNKDESLRDVRPGFGRREGWYAFIRTLKPKVVVETGVHHGVGACVITAALMRNAEEGYPGYYYGTDIDSSAGTLFHGKYSAYGEILYGDSVKSIQALKSEIDVLISDSDHNAEYECLEYEVAASKLSDSALVLSDNAHVTGELNAWSRSRSRPYVFFREEPHEHWYPGAGIGISPSEVPMMSSLGR